METDCNTDHRPSSLRAAGEPLRLSFCVVALALAGCQTYDPRPLERDAHRAEWHGRVVESHSLREFLARIDHGESDQAVELDVEDGLSLQEGRLVALAFNPTLRLARLRVGRAAAGLEQAGLRSDPALSLDVLRITESVPDAWIITSGLGFSIPLSGRLDAEEALAGAELGVARSRLEEAEWSVLHQVDAAWIEWSAALHRAEETQRLVEGMEGLVRSATQMAERGELLRTEALLFSLERAQRMNALRRLGGEAQVLEQQLRALLGLSPEAPVELLPALGPSTNRAAQDASSRAADLIEERNPTLARLRQEYAASEESLRREIAKQLPDLSLGPLFESDEGQSRIGLFGALPIPVLNANRRAIALARLDREIARAVLETEYESLVGRCSAASARVTALAEQNSDLEQVLIPLVEKQMTDALELHRLGEGSSLVLLESLTRSHQVRLELIDSRAAESLARAKLSHLIGPSAHRIPSEEKAGNQ